MALIKPGDWLIMLAAAATVTWLFGTLWHSRAGDLVIIRSGGKIIEQVSLFTDRIISVKGPLGTSVITIHDRKARVASDPSPRQYCVKQGWLAASGEAAICLPNQVSVEISGAKKLYDSLNY